MNWRLPFSGRRREVRTFFRGSGTEWALAALMRCSKLLWALLGRELPFKRLQQVVTNIL